MTAVVAVLLALLAEVGAGHAQEEAVPLGDWAVLPGFSLSVDTEGYELPTAVAFVPQPGDGPKDPLYFVTELRGAVKVVTNDRSVHTYASVPTFAPDADYPDLEGEAGLAGICLDPARGDVYVTFAYKDAGGVLRNGVPLHQRSGHVLDGEHGAGRLHRRLLPVPLGELAPDRRVRRGGRRGLRRDR